MTELKTFGFCKLISGNHTSKDRVCLNETHILDENGVEYDLTVGIYVAVSVGVSFDDFYRTEDIPINEDTDSLQIRTKSVLKDNKGRYYIKMDGKKILLDKVVVASMSAIFRLDEYA